MYVIVVYDAAPKRGVKLMKFLRQHLNWVQNSVFEGELTESGFENLKHGIKDIINDKKDSVIYYRFDSQNYHDRGIIGVEKNEIDSFI
ncbi:CRISPR-associated protein Cas2 [Melioribacter roseus P3M-2]|jgi:CRISPR-associated protein Cas2|uniref:CRISPR-associated endoribonuclease Cas2 n=1 Tax=Melioribacter roseus (strain DSM 23840 / JCM 17771 / VKM B-2668 / P3M-2) TaxID=1191523 RepID=I6ZPS9_MELRP|nr:CRISPR-associated endonuclease Cas2 [Melioribacter roseus]AFN74049.1 CRISPR-associated protein Cas2 [Melioribacter roseus P3M-2]